MECWSRDNEAKDVSRFGSLTPMRRPAQPHCSSYITGEILPIIGGYTGGRAGVERPTVWHDNC
jgi:hypothetical protein